jgi:hypothetical protein
LCIDSRDAVLLTQVIKQFTHCALVTLAAKLAKHRLANGFECRRRGKLLFADEQNHLLTLVGDGPTFLIQGQKHGGLDQFRP